MCPEDRYRLIHQRSSPMQKHHKKKKTEHGQCGQGQLLRMNDVPLREKLFGYSLLHQILCSQVLLAILSIHINGSMLNVRG